jgi:hypothetical protein
MLSTFIGIPFYRPSSLTESVAISSAPIGPHAKLTINWHAFMIAAFLASFNKGLHTAANPFITIRCEHYVLSSDHR